MSDEEYVVLKWELSLMMFVYGVVLLVYCLLGYGVASGLSAAFGLAGVFGYFRLF